MFHFTDKSTIDPCDFGELCPSTIHFETELAAKTALKKMENTSRTPYPFPEKAESAEDEYRILSTVKQVENSSFLEEHPQTSKLRGALTEEELEAKLLELVQSGYLDGYLDTELKYENGKVVADKTSIRYVEVYKSSWCSVSRVSPTLKVTDLGNALLDVYKAIDDQRNKARNAIKGLYDETWALNELSENVARLRRIMADTDLPTVTPKLWNQAERILNSKGSNRWTISIIAETLDCSRSTASVVVNKLVDLGVLVDYGNNWHNAAVYKTPSLAIAHIGGLTKLLGPKPE